ncbi:MAG TPA: hypothetical protein V6C81_07140 [Planktothrix sp.]|jgi:hypothetical protein
MITIELSPPAKKEPIEEFTAALQSEARSAIKSLRNHKTAAGCSLAALPLVGFVALTNPGEAVEQLSAGLGELVRTSDEARTLIPIEGYGADTAVAQKMEAIIASARNGVSSGRFDSAQKLESFIHDQYFAKIYPDLKPLAGEARTYVETGPSLKNYPYRPRMDALLGADNNHVAEASINNKSVKFVRSFKHDDDVLAEILGTRWQLPTDPEVFKAASSRKEELFRELVSSVGRQSPRMLDENVARAGEAEWLNAQTWKYNRGSAGISQLEARTWMEVAGIDSGRFRAGVDPNMEGLTSPYNGFGQAYKSMFEKPPQFYARA